jgi:predicted transcriptional regulator YheO
MDPYTASDKEVGVICINIFVSALQSSNAIEDRQASVGKEMKELFSHSCQGQLDHELIEKLKMFARYMKDAWNSPEGESVITSAMKVLGRFKRHEDRLRQLVEGKTGFNDQVILAACEMLRNGEIATTKE